MTPDAMPDLEEGDRGDAVKLLQEILNIKVDGIFGPKTALAVKEFKKANELYASDKVVSHVWRLLFKLDRVEHYD